MFKNINLIFVFSFFILQYKNFNRTNVQVGNKFSLQCMLSFKNL